MRTTPTPDTEQTLFGTAINALRCVGQEKIADDLDQRMENLLPVSEQTNPAVTFHDDLQALREKYPMTYIEAWTPDDFVSDSDKDDDDYDDDDTAPAPVNWNHQLHEITADNLRRHFDATIGTNWDRIREESVSIK